jgi:hypothetical protein
LAVPRKTGSGEVAPQSRHHEERSDVVIQAGSPRDGGLVAAVPHQTVHHGRDLD